LPLKYCVCNYLLRVGSISCSDRYYKCCIHASIHYMKMIICCFTYFIMLDHNQKYAVFSPLENVHSYFYWRKKLIFPREGAIRSEMRSSQKDIVIFDMKLDLWFFSSFLKKCILDFWIRTRFKNANLNQYLTKTWTSTSRKPEPVPHENLNQYLTKIAM